jgi:ethanolamine kinase
VCEKLAKMHKIRIDPPKRPFLFKKSQQFLDNLPSRFCDDDKQQKFEQYFSGKLSLFLIISFPILDVNFNDMFDEIRELVLKVKNKDQVLCHNDLLLNNLLHDSKEVHVIDYEYTAVNYQLFDLANHFNEWAGLFLR